MVVLAQDDSGSGSDSDNGSASSASSRSGTPPDSPGVEDRADRSPSPEQQHSPSPSPEGARSRGGSDRSASQSPVVNSRSPSGSPKSNRSRSGSANSHKSGSARSGSVNSNRSRSGSAKSNRSRSGSAKSNRSRSGSARSNRSRSGSARSSRSRSGSPKSNRSRSGTPKSNRSSGSAKSNRSRSGSPAKSSGNDSDKDAPKVKRKRAALSDASGSDPEERKKKSKKAGSSEVESVEGDGNLVIDAEALFGDASDISDDEDGEKKKEAKKLPSDAESDKEKEVDKHSDAGSERVGSGDEEGAVDEEKENVVEEPQPETRIEVEIPKITTNLGKELHFVKLPNFLSVETRPFDPETYEDEIDEEETLDEEGRARLKLKVENTIRWREMEGPTGTKRESNARFVRWSDGSMSLHLGSEIFDVYKQPLQGDHNHLFIRQGTGLQGQAVFRTKLSFRPHSTESFTHRKMTMSLADRSMKTSGIKMLSQVGKDPEAYRGELIKKEEERLKASVRRESRQKRVREKGASRSLSAGYLEPDRYGDGDGDSDDESISINAIKKQHSNKPANKGDRPNIYSSDEDASDIETRRARRLDKAKALKDSDEESGGGAGGASANSASDNDDG